MSVGCCAVAVRRLQRDHVAAIWTDADACNRYESRRQA